ncbi:MAG: ATP/GTP-binding protein [Candidatus Parabeggiatoa sp.]|nr:ATP/GTP-binding protein [Candidatus Parabeggiatoa sp.]
MLLQFIVENVMCFAEETLFSMVASAELEQHKSHLISMTPKTDLLRTTALYGANAHGKTKWVDAISFAKQLIVNGVKGTQSIPVDPFRLDKQLKNKPSRFEFLIFYQNIHYHYGFIINAQRVLEEWLFVTPKIKEVRYFERITSENGKVTIELGGSLARRNSKQRQFLEFVAEGTRPNQLFLTEALERNVAKLKPLYEWFEEVLEVIPATPHYLPLEIRANKEKPFITFLSDFLKQVDTGIQAIKTVEEEFDYDKHFPGLPEQIRLEIENDIRKGGTVIMLSEGSSYTLCANESGEPVLIRLETQHYGHDGSLVSFDFAKESAGTQRLTHLLPILADLFVSEKVYIIDELDRSLHALLPKLFLETYLKGVSKKHQSQLIFTTHDTHLLDLNLLRQDEIWFLEKDEHGGSHLYSLVNLKMNSDLNIQKGYLQGRFGGIPFLGDLEQLDGFSQE